MSDSDSDEVIEIDLDTVEKREIEELLRTLEEEIDAKDPEKPQPIVEASSEIPIIIPDHNETWRLAVDARVQNKPITTNTETAVWETMMARSSEILGVSQISFDENIKQLTFAAASAKNDVSRAQATIAAQLGKRIAQILRERQIKESEFWKAMQDDDVEMLRSLLKTVLLLQGTYLEEEKRIRQRAERRGSEVDLELQPRQRQIQDRFEKIKGQCHAVLQTYGHEIENLGPPLKSLANETIQALTVIQTVKKDSAMGEDVIALVSCLHTSIQNMQDMIDQEPNVFDIPEATPLVSNTEMAALQVSLQEVNEKIREATKRREDLAKQLLSAWSQPTGFTDGIKEETEVRQKLLELEESKKNLEHQISKLKGEETIALLEAKRRQSEQVKKDHFKWVKLLKNLSAISDQLARDMEALHRDRQRSYSLIISDTARELDAMVARKTSEINRATALLTQNVIQKKTKRMMMWKASVEPFDRELQQAWINLTTVVEQLSISDVSLALLASATKDSLMRLQSEMVRLQSIKLYLSVLKSMRAAKDVFETEK